MVQVKTFSQMYAKIKFIFENFTLG